MHNRSITAILISLIFGSGFLSAQQIRLTLDPDFEVMIIGTSNVRDWDAPVTFVNADFIMSGFDFDNLDDLKPDNFETMTLLMPVEDIDNDSRRLRRNIHNYLKKDEHPFIIFELDHVNEVNVNNNTAIIVAVGTITAAGQSHTVDMQVNVEKDDNGSLIFSGSQDMKMTDFGIDPPTALLGTIRADDDITIVYRVRFVAGEGPLTDEF